MPSPAAKKRKEARALMIEDNKSKRIFTCSPYWWVECIKCKTMIYQLHKIRVDQTMKGHTTAIIDGIYKWVAPHNFNTMGIYDKIDVCWTCFDCYK